MGRTRDVSYKLQRAVGQQSFFIGSVSISGRESRWSSMSSERRRWLLGIVCKQLKIIRWPWRVDFASFTSHAAVRWHEQRPPLLSCCRYSRAAEFTAWANTEPVDMIDASTREAGVGVGGQIGSGGRFHYTEHASKCQRASVRGGRFNSWGRGEMTGVEPIAPTCIRLHGWRDTTQLSEGRVDVSGCIQKNIF